VVVENTEIPLPGIAGPLELAKARLIVRDGAATRREFFRPRPAPGPHARFRWDATTIETTELAAQWGKGSISGHLVANLRRAIPSYRLTARFPSVEWVEGTWDGRGLLETSGTGTDLARNLRLESAFKGQPVSLAPDTELESVSGSCLVTVARGLPRFRFTGLQAVLGEEVYQGQGATGEDGRVSFELTSGPKQMRLTGTLSPFQLSPG
jgi:hypothetical protein